MWIDLGIDTGNILTTKCVNLDGKEDLNEIHLKVMNQSHELYLKSISFLEIGKTQSVPQNKICDGTTYYTKDWGTLQKLQLIKNFDNWDRSIEKIYITERQQNIIKVETNDNQYSFTEF